MMYSIHLSFIVCEKDGEVNERQLFHGIPQRNGEDTENYYTYDSGTSEGKSDIIVTVHQNKYETDINMYMWLSFKRLQEAPSCSYFNMYGNLAY